MKPIDLRVRDETLKLAYALAMQRGVERAALLREALDVGLLLLAASGPPDEERSPAIYGTLSGLRLAQRLRPRIAPVLDFLSQYDATPIIAPTVAAPAKAQPHSPVADTIPVDAGVGTALEAFGIAVLGAAGEDPSAR